MNLDIVIRKIKNFPKPNILFYDVTSIFTNPTAFSYVLSQMSILYEKETIDGVIAIESRGFVVGAPFALARNIPLVLARKKGKLPGKTIEESYALEYGEATLQMHVDDVNPGKRWLIVDDLIATGGTIEAVAKMIKRRDCHVVGVFSIIGLPFLHYEKKIGMYNPVTLINYHSE